jgi:D-alanyl-D-alanine carboxypeptidase
MSMAISQNGFTALAKAPPGTLDKWVTGRVAGGDIAIVFDYLCTRFNAEVEKINKAWSWGWAPRPIRGSTVTSNHASGTAIDLNAPVHQLGKVNTFSAKQQTRIRAILKDLIVDGDTVIRWGGDYKSRKDDMHFEIDAPVARIKKLADKIRAGKAGKVTPAWVPKKGIRSRLDLIQIQFQIAQKVKTGKVIRYNGIGRIQQELNKRGANLTVDGYCGTATVKAWVAYESKLPAAQKSGRAGTPDPKSLEPLGLIFAGPEAK